VLSRPASLEVARLVGMSNLVEGLVRADSSQGELELSRVEIDAHHHLPVQTSLPPGTRVWAGVRPERLKVDVGRGEGLPVGKGVVESVVSDGVAVTVQVGWAGYDLRTHLLAGRGLARTIAPGDSVTLSVRPEDVHLIERL
jgi:ABC-type Fe3+/spermidine/putrescine transport system ATPase subunit